MDRPASEAAAPPGGLVSPAVRGRLFRKYAAMFAAVVCAALVANGAFEIWFSYQEQKNLLFRIQHEQAAAAATSITQFVAEIRDQLAWSTLLPWDAGTFQEWRFDAVRLLREVPAVTEVAQIDRTGRELFRVSRQAMDVAPSGADRSHEPFFARAMADKIYYGPVYFVGGSEPYMTVAMAGERPDYGVIEAQVNLKFIWDVVSRIKAGHNGYAFVVDGDGRLIAHPDLSLVLRDTDMSRSPQLQAARAARPEVSSDSLLTVPTPGGPVLSAYAAIEPLHWLVFVELPESEAFASITNSIFRSAGVLLAALALALLAALALARKMVVPIRALHDSAVRLGGGNLAHRISIRTRDELEALGHQFNAMAAQLEETHATLEAKVEERTRQLEDANLAKSRFLAAASHDLRQPLHAIGLFVAQLHGRLRGAERKLVVGRIEAALAAMNDLFNALLDISKLDAGGMTVNLTDFPAAKLLAHAENTFGEAARAKGLSLRVVPCGAWIRSDFILLERVVFNIVSNAVRYTRRGGIVVGCRKRGEALRIEVCDTGVGIPADQQARIFGEFYRLGEPDRDRSGGLGLGLAIVERLCRLLGHAIDVRSVPGKGSVFAVTVPMVAARARPPRPQVWTSRALEPSRGELVLVIDDDPFVRDGMDGIFRSWGCRVITAETAGEALKALAEERHRPDLIISDYYLANGTTGVETVESLRAALAAPIPAFLISGNIEPEPLSAAKAKGIYLLHKPVDPMALRAMFQRALSRSLGADGHAAQIH